MGHNEGEGKDDLYSAEEAKRRFEDALRGARGASSHRMSEFIGKGKRDGDSRKSRVKKTVKQSQNSAEFRNPLAGTDFGQSAH